VSRPAYRFVGRAVCDVHLVAKLPDARRVQSVPQYSTRALPSRLGLARRVVAGFVFCDPGSTNRDSSRTPRKGSRKVARITPPALDPDLRHQLLQDGLAAGDGSVLDGCGVGSRPRLPSPTAKTPRRATSTLESIRPSGPESSRAQDSLLAGVEVVGRQDEVGDAGGERAPGRSHRWIGSRV